MSPKIKGAGKTASKSKPKNSSKNSSLNSKKRPFNITRAFLAVFLLVMLAWLAALMMIKEEPQAKKANLAQNNNTQKIHELLESKKKKSSVLDEQNSSQGISQKISKDNKIANIYEEISDEKLKEFSKKLQEQKEEFIAKTAIEQNISEQNASKEQSTFEKTAEQAPKYSYSANSHSKLKSHKVPNGGPKLAIIMDDISTNAQASELKKLSIKVTPSIFPPEKQHPKTAELAKEFSVYMVHLPLQALNYTNEKANTLRTGDSKEKISQRIKDIKNDFKGVKYINNHTGSGFTSDFKSTLALLDELKNSEIYFIDSLTTNKSTVLDASKKLGLKYAYRDVFLDNEQNVSKILKMINNAVAVAKKDGVAIAICHPYKSTFEALKIAQKDAFKGVEVVYVDKIYEHYK
ncbi:divergent polysaccharide deacetylase family protein [Campylobacter sp. 46490-21]|uniref:divergent polysaccharide deacetylase family protein n=1 Tax=Campylobacter magnus TaxID=3026462 RepID=UPI0023603F37|nr:divergent polysaccharide deacetylase family protein [Campylobacter magnus]MDD0847892.1 divergent polysaccharide deacetylase family protein [Campylobacter magnus]